MNLKGLFQDFNPSKFLVYICLFIFTLVFALRIDEIVESSFWLVFLPLWFWKCMVILGAVIAGAVWWRHPEYRIEGEGYIDMKAIIICLALNSLLLIFEILVCDQLENPRASKPWLIVFMPLFLTSPVSIAACVWGFKHDRGLELEAMCSINILQFIFIALKLDNIINWRWGVVFIPLWILTCLMCLIVLYYVIWSLLILRATELMAQQRRTNLMTALTAVSLVAPLLTFEILLVNRLDGINAYPFSAVFCPLYIALLVLLPTAFGQRGGNQWWFGIRKDFCSFLLGTCPFLQEYGNISINVHQPDQVPEGEEMQRDIYLHSRQAMLDYKMIMPVISIDMPD